MELSLLLVGSNVAILAGAVMCVSMIRRRLEKGTAAVRAIHLAELEKGKRYLSVMRHELGLDAAALVLACHELAGLRDEQGNEVFPGGCPWEAIRSTLRKMAMDSQQKVRIQVARVD